MAAAEWTQIGGNDQTSFYADLATRTPTGDAGRAMWTLFGSKKPRNVGPSSFSSIKTRFEFDCAGKRIRELETAFYSGTMADGQVVGAHEEGGPWEAIVEGTVKDVLSTIACEKS